MPVVILSEYLIKTSKRDIGLENKHMNFMYSLYNPIIRQHQKKWSSVFVYLSLLLMHLLFRQNMKVKSPFYQIFDNRFHRKCISLGAFLVKIESVVHYLQNKGSCNLCGYDILTLKGDINDVIYSMLASFKNSG